MNENQKVGAPPTMGLADILYVIFRHKGKIALISVVGLMATASLPFLIRPKYESEAKLLIKYVVEGRSPPQVGNQSTVQPADDGETIINTELQILNSSDLALQVADAVGPQSILAATGGGTNRYQAAGVIQNPKNLITESPKRSNVIRVAFQHPDPLVAQAVVSQLIESYIKKHAEIHRGGGFDEFLTQETDQLHSRLLDTEEALRKEKNRLGINSVEQARKFQDDQISKIKEKLLDAREQLAEKEAAFSEINGLTNFQATTQTNIAAATKAADVPPETVADYSSICGLLDSLRKKEQNLLLTFTPASSFVKETRERILANETAKKQLETQNPGLLSLKVTEIKAAGGDIQLARRSDEVTARAEIGGLRAKIVALQGELEEVQKGAAVLGASESSILELQRRKAMEEGYYSNFSESLEQSHINERLGAGKISNISIIQAPSPPGPVASKLRKMMGMTLLGSVGGALGLAFLLEFFLDRSIKRPVDVETKLRLPFFLAIPRLSMNGKSALRKGPSFPLLAAGTGNEKSTESGGSVVVENEKGRTTNGTHPHEMEVAPWDPANKLRPFSEALRDRLITYFELNNLTHKPKLVAVTGCGEGSGVSTVASGLAASLSETGEGNVLLVDMNAVNGAAHHFYKGDLRCGIDEALETGKRESALVQQNLYVVSESPNSDKMHSVLPKRFKDLVPKLKASDFDYIVFDMPPVSQISLTPRLARFMDIVLLVIESEKTDLDIVKHASALLTASKANVGVVLNKSRSYVPKWIQQEF
jgi:polysaccharide biosynthesis transport protein